MSGSLPAEKKHVDAGADRPGGAGLVWICLGDDALKSIACGGDYGRGHGVG